MKNRILLSGVCLVVLLASATWYAQDVAPQTRVAGIEPSRDLQEACPAISVSCPNDPNVSEPLDFRIHISGGDPKVTPIYIWEVYGGVITSGQGTPAIKVQAFGSQAVTATLRVDGLDAVCANTASCTTPIHHLAPQAQRFDSYSILSINKEKARLDLFAAELKPQPEARGYLLVYGGRGVRAGKANKRAARALEYLVKTHGIDADRIVTVDAGVKGRLTIELWVVPTGAIPPAADPTGSRP